MFLVDIKLNAKTRKILSTFLTFMNLLAVLEAKTVLLCGVYLHIKHAELSDVIGDGFALKALPILAEVMGVMGLCISSFAVYVLFRCRIESYRRRKSLIPTIATNLLVLLAFTWLALVILTMNVFSFQGDSRTDILGLRLEYIFEGVIREAMRLYKKDVVVKSAIDRMQMKLECCGEDLYTDWLQLAWVNEKYLSSEENSNSFTGSLNYERAGYELQGVPFSCCDLNSNKPCHYRDIRSEPFFQKHEDKTFTIHAKGCKSAINAYMLETIKVFGLVAITNVVFNFSAAISSRFLIYATFIDDPTLSSADGSTLTSAKNFSPYSSKPTTFLEMSIRKTPSNSRPTSPNAIETSATRFLNNQSTIPLTPSPNSPAESLVKNFGSPNPFFGTSTEPLKNIQKNVGANTCRLQSPLHSPNNILNTAMLSSPTTYMNYPPRQTATVYQARSTAPPSAFNQNFFPLLSALPNYYCQMTSPYQSTPQSSKRKELLSLCPDNSTSPYSSLRSVSPEFVADDVCTIDSARLNRSKQICEANCGTCNICRFNYGNKTDNKPLCFGSEDKSSVMLQSNKRDEATRPPIANVLEQSSQQLFPQYQQPLFNAKPLTEISSNANFFPPFQPLNNATTHPTQHNLQQQPQTQRSNVVSLNGANISNFQNSPSFTEQPFNQINLARANMKNPSMSNLASNSYYQFQDFALPSSPLRRPQIQPSGTVNQVYSAPNLTFFNPTNVSPFKLIGPRVENMPSQTKINNQAFISQQERQLITQEPRQFLPSRPLPPLPKIESFQISKPLSSVQVQSFTWKQPSTTLAAAAENSLSPKLELPSRNVRPGQKMTNNIFMQQLLSPNRLRLPSIPEQNLTKQNLVTPDTTFSSSQPGQTQTISTSTVKQLVGLTSSVTPLNKPLLPLRQPLLPPPRPAAPKTNIYANIEMKTPSAINVEYNRESVIMSEILSLPDLCETEVSSDVTKGNVLTKVLTTATTTTGVTTTTTATTTTTIISTTTAAMTTFSNVSTTARLLPLNATTTASLTTQTTVKPLPFATSSRFFSQKIDRAPSDIYTTIKSPRFSNFGTYQNKFRMPTGSANRTNVTDIAPPIFTSPHTDVSAGLRHPTIQTSFYENIMPLPILKQGMKTTSEVPRVCFQNPISRSFSLSPIQSYSVHRNMSNAPKNMTVNQSTFRQSNYNASNVTHEDLLNDATTKIKSEIMVNNNSNGCVKCKDIRLKLINKNNNRSSSNTVFNIPAIFLTDNKTSENNPNVNNHIYKNYASKIAHKTNRNKFKVSKKVSTVNKHVSSVRNLNNLTDSLKVPNKKCTTVLMAKNKKHMKRSKVKIKKSGLQTNSKMSIEITSKENCLRKVGDKFERHSDKSFNHLHTPVLSSFSTTESLPKSIDQIDKPEICIKTTQEIKLKLNKISVNANGDDLVKFIPTVCITKCQRCETDHDGVECTEENVASIELTKMMEGKKSHYLIGDKLVCNNNKNRNSNNNNNETRNFLNLVGCFDIASLGCQTSTSKNIKYIAELSNNTLNDASQSLKISSPHCLPRKSFHKLRRHKTPVHVDQPQIIVHEQNDSANICQMLSQLQYNRSTNAHFNHNKSQNYTFDNQNDNQKSLSNYTKFTDSVSDESEILKLLAKGLSGPTGAGEGLPTERDSLDKIIEYLGGYSLNDLASSSSYSLSEYTKGCSDILHSSSMYFYNLLTNKYPWLRSRLSHSDYCNSLLNRGLLSAQRYDTCAGTILNDYLIPRNISYLDPNNQRQDFRPISAFTPLHHSIIHNNPLLSVSKIYSPLTRSDSICTGIRTSTRYNRFLDTSSLCSFKYEKSCNGIPTIYTPSKKPELNLHSPSSCPSKCSKCNHKCSKCNLKCTNHMCSNCRCNRCCQCDRCCRCDRCCQCGCCCRNEPNAGFIRSLRIKKINKPRSLVCESVTDIIPLDDVPDIELSSNDEEIIEEYSTGDGDILLELNQYCPLDQAYIDLDRYPSAGDGQLNYKTRLPPKNNRKAIREPTLSDESESEYAYDKSKAMILKKMTEQLIKNSKKIRKRLIKLPKVKKSQLKNRKQVDAKENYPFMPIHQSYEKIFLKEKAYLEQRKELKQLFGESFVTKWNNPETVVRQCSCTGLTHDTSPCCGYKSFKSKKKNFDESNSSSLSSISRLKNQIKEKIAKNKIKKSEKKNSLGKKNNPYLPKEIKEETEGSSLKSSIVSSNDSSIKSSNESSVESSMESSSGQTDESKGEKDIANTDTIETNDAGQQGDPNLNGIEIKKTINNSNKLKNVTDQSSHNMPSNFNSHQNKKDNRSQETVHFNCNSFNASKKTFSNHNECDLNNSTAGNCKYCTTCQERSSNNRCSDFDKNNFTPIPKPRSLSPMNKILLTQPRNSSIKMCEKCCTPNPKPRTTHFRKSKNTSTNSKIPIPSPRKISFQIKNKHKILELDATKFDQKLVSASAPDNFCKNKSQKNLIPKIIVSSTKPDNKNYCHNQLKSNKYSVKLKSQSIPKNCCQHCCENNYAKMSKSLKMPTIMVNKKVINNSDNQKKLVNNSTRKKLVPLKIPKIFVSGDPYFVGTGKNEEWKTSKKSVNNGCNTKITISRNVGRGNINVDSVENKISDSHSKSDNDASDSSDVDEGTYLTNHTENSNGTGRIDAADKLNFRMYKKNKKFTNCTRKIKIEKRKNKTDHKIIPGNEHMQENLDENTKCRVKSFSEKNEIRPKDETQADSKLLNISEEILQSLMDKSCKTNETDEISTESTMTSSSSKDSSSSDTSSFGSWSSHPASTQRPGDTYDLLINIPQQFLRPDTCRHHHQQHDQR
ncbi:hypothetical protein HELRODRAFT_170345 [Helobdella robusta]|uniref:Tetraspanin n=1 Tax=Helobdella robusta TaxID=6412 RepID=T1F2Y3_HELRO|nr:hypothetical protein HELRODRAFT_170345 [Helobdella robusta]ESO07792.1 hypothetical protein HELRODRAFT_170345 [Helobdella robusta]